MEKSSREHRSRSRHPILLAITVMVFGAAALVAVIGPNTLLERAIVVILEQNGLAPAAVTVSHFGPKAIELSNLRAAGARALEIGHARLAIEWRSFVPRLGEVEISGLHARLQWEEGALRLGGQNLLGDGTPAAVPSTPGGAVPALAATVRVTESTIIVDGLGARLTLATNGAVQLSPTGGRGRLDIRVEPAAGDQAIAGHQGRLDLRSDARGALDADVALTPAEEAEGARAGVTGWLGISGDRTRMAAALEFKDVRVPALGLDVSRLSLAAAQTPRLSEPLIVLEMVGVGYQAAPAFRAGAVEAVARLRLAPASTEVKLQSCVELAGLSTAVLTADHLRICPDASGKPLLAFTKKRNTVAASLLSAQLSVREKTGSTFARGQSPTINLSGMLEGDRWTGALTASGGDLSLQGRVIRLTDLSLSGTLAGRGGTLSDGHLTLSNASIRDWTPEPLFAPLTFTGQGGIADNRVDMRAAASRDGTAEMANAVLHHDLETRIGRIDLALDRQIFKPGGLQPGALVPFVKGHVTDASGEVSGTAWFAWDASSVASGAEVRLKALGFTTGLGRLDGVEGDVTLSSLSPPRTSRLQTIHVGLMDLGVPLPNGKLSFTIEPDRTLRVREATWTFLDGTVGLSAGQFGTGDTQSATFAVNHVNLAKLLELVDVKGLSGTGFLSGSMPVTLTRSAQTVVGGRLAADGPGTLSYKTESALGDAEESGILFKALDNFQYQALHATVDGDLSGELSVGIHLKGSNPKLYNSYPIELNVSTNGPFVSMVRKGLYRYQPSSPD